MKNLSTSLIVKGVVAPPTLAQDVALADLNFQDILVADRETHTRQRRLLSHAFSEKALREQEGILTSYVTKLLEQLRKRCAMGPVNMVSWYNFTSKLPSSFSKWLSYLSLAIQLSTSSAIWLLERTSAVSTLANTSPLSVR